MAASNTEKKKLSAWWNRLEYILPIIILLIIWYAVTSQNGYKEYFSKTYNNLENSCS